MNPLLWALISLQLTLPPKPAPPVHFEPVVWDIRQTNRGAVRYTHQCTYELDSGRGKINCVQWQGVLL